MVQFTPEGNLVKLMQDGFVEALANTVCLRMTCLCLGMLYAVYTQIQLVIVRFELAAIFRASVRQDADNAHFL